MSLVAYRYFGLVRSLNRVAAVPPARPPACKGPLGGKRWSQINTLIAHAADTTVEARELIWRKGTGEGAAAADRPTDIDARAG